MKVVVFALICAALGGAGDPPPSGEMSSDEFVEWHAHEAAGWSALGRGHADVAEREFRVAVRIAQPHGAKDPRLLARTYNSLAWALHVQGRDEDALPLAEWALVVREARNGPKSEQVSETLYVLAMVENALQRPDLAEARLARVLTIQEGKQGRESYRVAGALVDLAVAQIERRKYGSARASLERVLAMPTSAVDSGDVLRVLANVGLADIEEAVGDDERAAALLRTAWSLGRDHKDLTADTRVELKARLIRVLRRVGRAAEAAELEKSGPDEKKRPSTGNSSAA